MPTRTGTRQAVANRHRLTNSQLVRDAGVSVGCVRRPAWVESPGCPVARQLPVASHRLHQGVSWLVSCGSATHFALDVLHRRTLRVAPFCCIFLAWCTWPGARPPRRGAPRYVTPSLLLPFCSSCHAASHGCARARPLTRLLLCIFQRVLCRHVRPEPRSVVHLSANSAFDFSPAALSPMGVHMTMVALVLIDALAGKLLAAVQAPRVFR